MKSRSIRFIPGVLDLLHILHFTSKFNGILHHFENKKGLL